MRIGVVRIIGESLKDLFLCLLLSPFLAGSNTQIVMSGGAFWIDRDRLVQLHDRVIEFRLPILNNAQRGEQKVVVGRNGRGSFQGRLRRAQFAAPNINRAEVGKRVKVVWVVGQNLLILFFCSLKIALLKVLPSRSDETLDFRWYSGLGLIRPVHSCIAPTA